MEDEEIRSEAVWLLRISAADTLARSGPADTSRWHLIDVMHDRTWCGLSIAHTAQRQLWSDTVAEERCELCLLAIRNLV
jgi:hypothetical protein